ncbi:MAG: 50S ribosomal protein L29 [Alphaproteobacteria bacterium CG_4_10_14_0_2_um_filter_63_37]|nr:MAG: 50S ribosomal protein L29 [Proteobacteria bacterium CG1_02_64_396]PJA25560.1 MAG: 50S ribosomal protein L29 [Alphaproteobacteria bacterium CG_4_10_14_0_2_um_filter_63_37]
MADAKELRGMSDAALQSKLGELLKEQMGMRFQHAMAQLENTARIRQVRREVAQVRTIITEKQREGGQ